MMCCAASVTMSESASAAFSSAASISSSWARTEDCEHLVTRLFSQHVPPSRLRRPSADEFPCLLGQGQQRAGEHSEG